MMIITMLVQQMTIVDISMLVHQMTIVEREKTVTALDSEGVTSHFTEGVTRNLKQVYNSWNV